jgi:hypothetical protein
MSCVSPATRLPTRSGHSTQIWEPLLAHSHCRLWKIGGRDSSQSRRWRRRKRIDCGGLAFLPQQDFDRLGDRLLPERAFEMRICLIERRSRRRMSLDRESWMPGWPARESRAHAAEGLNRAWYPLLLAIASACFSARRGGEIREADVYIMVSVGSSRSSGNIQLYGQRRRMAKLCTQRFGVVRNETEREMLAGRGQLVVLLVSKFFVR